MKPKKKIAIIGSGISGLYLAWKISKKFNVTVYEKNNYFNFFLLEVKFKNINLIFY